MNIEEETTTNEYFSVSEYVLEIFEKKYSKHFPKKRNFHCDNFYLESKNDFKESLFQWIYEENPWEKEDPKRITFEQVNDFFNFMTLD